MALAVVCAAGVLVGLAGGASSAGASDQAPSYYLALGGSGSVGFQPTAAHPEGQRTDRGYANDLVVAERSRWSDLSLVELGCPGATTETMLSGGGKCPYAEGSQLDAAVAFLHDHPSTVLVTLDLGFNDVERCLRHETLDEDCATLAIDRVRDQLPVILDRLRAAGGPGLEIVGVGHYDPFLGYYVDGPDGPPFASASLGVIGASQRHLAGRLRRRRRPHGQRGGGLRRDGHRGHRRTGHRRGAAQRGAGLRAHLGLCPVTVGSQPASQRRRLPGHRRGHRRRLAAH